MNNKNKHWLIYLTIITCFLFINTKLQAGSTRYFRIPPCPAGSVITVFTPIAESADWGIHIKKTNPVIDVRDAKPYLEKMGIQFPKGGFALYFVQSRTLIVTVDVTNKDSLEALLFS